MKDIRKKAAALLAVLMLCSVLPVCAAGPAFADVPGGSWFAAPVQWAVAQEITNGTSATTFSPNTTCTKAQVLTFLWRAFGSPDPTPAQPFTDISGGTFYYKAALWAYENGMVDAGAFQPNAPCTRSMAVTYLWKAAGRPAAAADTGFTDVPADCAQAVAWAVARGVTNGMSETTFAPAVTCTRAQIVTFLYRDLGDRLDIIL